MDLQTVERKVKTASYTTPEDFEYDILLIFQNCIAYNAARKSDHLVSMGKWKERIVDIVSWRKHVRLTFAGLNMTKEIRSLTRAAHLHTTFPYRKKKKQLS